MENKLPISRLSKFFSENDFDLHMELGKEYLHGDVNMKIILYRVDINASDTDNIYAEAGKDQIKYLTPVEINCLVRIADPKNSAYKNGMVRYLEPGNMAIYVYLKELNDLNVEIKLGDYIGYEESENFIRYYSVTDDGRVVSDNKHSHFGYKPGWRTIICAPAQENEFRGI
jgi:hypothetical protein